LIAFTSQSPAVQMVFIATTFSLLSFCSSWVACLWIGFGL
jgi:hypothetical protein